MIKDPVESLFFFFFCFLINKRNEVFQYGVLQLLHLDLKLIDCSENINKTFKVLVHFCLQSYKQNQVLINKIIKERKISSISLL